MQLLHDVAPIGKSVRDGTAAATDLGIETAAVKRLERQTKGQERQPTVQDELAKTHDNGHPPCSSLRPHRTRSFHRSCQRDVQKLENGRSDGQNPSLRYFRSRMFLGERRVPQTAARVEQISEWITMWWGFKAQNS